MKFRPGAFAARPVPIMQAISWRLSGIVALMAILLVGCASPQRAPDLAPPVQIAESVWWQVDSDIVAASRAATGPARNYARGFMESWRNLVSRRIETDFIPWFTGYWTQQWLAIRVAWYKLSLGAGEDPATIRLAAYLQEQFRDRVLDPVAKEIDPDVVRAKATRLYVQLLGEQLQAIPRRYGVPQDQFDRRLKSIPAISLAPPPDHDASLHALVNAAPIDTLPAYVALTAVVRQGSAGVGGGPSSTRISPVAKRASEKLMARLATSGGAGAAAAAVGGVAGMVISLGAVGFGAIAHANERPEMEAQLRQHLGAALDDMWQAQMADPASGVMAEVGYLSGRIEASLAGALVRPVARLPEPREIPLPIEQVLSDDEGEDELLRDEQAEE
ncbi:hypothetical protein [Accumulibacter sp.]|uniref:hypothetical protein n=1 Tax=Accumulibacter sp. TaxID=2053492 RepID=UPI00261D81F8|nr:hypothetical protein [Accumulibacter sp.]